MLSQRLQGLRGAVHAAAAGAADAARTRSLTHSTPLPLARPPARPIGFLYQNRHERLTQTKGRAGREGGTEGREGAWRRGWKRRDGQ